MLLIATFSLRNGEYKPAVMAVAELGGLYKLTTCTDLYVGAYFNYGINNVLTPDTKLMYEPEGVYNGVFATNQVNSVVPVCVGLKVGLYLQLGK